MSTQVFGFLVAVPYEYGDAYDTVVSPANFGVNITRKDSGDWGIYRIDRLRVIVPANAKTMSDWVDFIRDHAGEYDTFLFKDRMTAALNKSEFENCGTGNASNLDFALDMKHVDASTLIVWKNGVQQTLTTHYTLINNNTTPTIRFVSAPANGHVIEATYEYYFPVRFSAPPSFGVSRIIAENAEVDVGIVEDFAGAHRVA